MIFIDSNFWIALFNTVDACHKKALQLHQALADRFPNSRLIVNNLITAETLTVLSQKGGKLLALQFYETLTTSHMIDVVYVDAILEQEAMAYFRKIASKNISFADCTIFATTDRYFIKDVISFDEDLKYKKDIHLIHDPNQLS